MGRAVAEDTQCLNCRTLTTPLLLTGHNHHGVGPRYGRSEQGDEAEEGSLVRAGHSDDSDRFVDLDDGP